MARSSRGFSRGARRGRKRPTYWAQEKFSTLLGPAADQASQDISHISISLGDNAGGTCLRVIGNLNYFHNAATFEQFNIGVGIAVVTKDALAAGALPDPLSDLEQDWYYWHSWEGLLGFSDGQHQENFDIRTARKLREGYRLAFMMQSFTQELEGEIQVNLRTLWTLE